MTSEPPENPPGDEQKRLDHLLDEAFTVFAPEMRDWVRTTEGAALEDLAATLAVLEEHEYRTIGTHEDDGSRTFTTPGDVCVTCSDEETGRWVPVSFCPALVGDPDEAMEAQVQARIAAAREEHQ